MSGNQTTSAGTPEAAPRRKREARPPMVALSDFGKAPPPPPRIKMTPRQIATSSAAAIVILLVVWFGAVQIGQVADAKWSGAGALDQRNR